MKNVLKILIFVIAFLFSGCAYNLNESENNTFVPKGEYMVKNSVIPHDISFRSDESNERLNYDYLKAIWISYIDLAPMLTGKTEQQFRDNFETACKNVLKAKCNTVFVHVRPFGDAIYRSDIYPISYYLTGKYETSAEFDPLSIMTEIAHKNNISIHAWINPLRLESEEHLKQIDDKFKIKQWYNAQNDYVCSVDAEKHLWLNPGYEEVRKLIADGAQEIARKYDVDGIHYDDYFYPTTQEKFDVKCFSALSKGKELSVWRMENISSMVKMIYNAVKSVNKNIVVGVSPQGNLENNYNYMFADVKKWSSETGYIDYICPQIYYGYNNSVKPFLKTLKDWTNVVTCKDVKLYVGLAVYKTIGNDSEFVRTTGIIAKQISDIAALDKCKGFVLYKYLDMFNDNQRSKTELDLIIKQLQ